MDYKGLLKELKAGIIHPVYFFTGSESYIANMMEKRIRDACMDEALMQLNYNRFDTKQTDFTEVFAACETLPVMVSRRVVVLGGQTGTAGITDKKTLDSLERYLSNPSPGTVLIVHEPKPDKRKKAAKLLSAKAVCVDYPKLSLQGILGWIAARSKRADVPISRGAAEYLVARTHYLDNEKTDTQTIDHELDKLIDYVGEGGRITEDTVTEVIAPGTEDNVFTMTGLIAAGKINEALAMLEYFYREGESPIGIFALIVRQVRNMTMVRLAGNGRQAAQAVKLPPFVVERVRKQACVYTQERLFALMQEAAQYDLQMKTGVIDAAFAVEMYILQMMKKK